jgi:hypothetical protein
MIRTLYAVLIAIGLGLALPMAAKAESFRWQFQERSRALHHGYGHSASVPELDPSAAGSALTLVAGGLMLLGSRRRKAP